jgi:hypothetical protein
MASFIDVDGQFINLDHVVKIAPLQAGKCRFEFADGMATLTLTKFDPSDDLPRNEAVVPASPGWRVIVGAACQDEFDFEAYDLEEIIAFRIGTCNAVPITAQTGDMAHNFHVQPRDYAIVSPSGEVMDWVERWPSIEAFVAYKREKYDAMVRALALATANTDEPV